MALHQLYLDDQRDIPENKAGGISAITEKEFNERGGAPSGGSRDVGCGRGKDWHGFL
jgi:hypothetical protein